MQITFIIGHSPANDIEFKAGGVVFFMQDCLPEEVPSPQHVIHILDERTSKYRIETPDGEYRDYDVVFHSHLADCVLLRPTGSVV